MRLGFFIPVHDFSGQGTGARPELSPGIYGRIDPGVDPVADDCAQFSAAGIHQFTFDHALVVAAVVAEIGGDGAAAEVHFFAENAVSGVAEMRDGRAVHQY